MLTVQNADVYTDINGLAKLKSDAQAQSPEALAQVAKQFESLFLNMVLKSMRQAKLDDGLMDNNQSKFYQDMYDQQLSVHLSGEPGIGLAELMVKQLSPAEQNNAIAASKDLSDYWAHPVQNAGGAKALPKSQGDRDGVTYATLQNGSAKIFAVPPTSNSTPSLEAIPEAPEIEDSPYVTGMDSKQVFVTQLLPMAEKAAAELGVEPKVLIAQAALETGWGHSVIKNRDGSSSYNLFNIKAGSSWEGKQARVATLEFEQGVPTKVVSGFRAYDSYADSFNDYVKFIKEKPRYADALKQVSNPAQYMRELQQAGYATDPNYAGKVMHIFNSKAFADSVAEQTLAMR